MTEKSQVADIDRSIYDIRDAEHDAYRMEAGLTPAIVEKLSKEKNDPAWMEQFRLESLQIYNNMRVPDWGPSLEGLDIDHIATYVRPNTKMQNNWENVPQDIKDTFERLGIPQAERKSLAGVGAQYDSELVYHNVRAEVAAQGVVYTDMESALHGEYADMVRKYFMKLVTPRDHKFAALHGAVWSGGSFVYVPKGVQVSIPLQSYFRLNAKGAGQFEHTLIIVDEGASLHFIEGCSAPKYNVANLHAGCVELYVKKGAKLRYSTIENWSKNMYNLNTKRALVEEDGTIEWISGSFGSHVGCLYPMSILKGDRARMEFTGVTFAGAGQNLDTGAKVVHVGKNTSSYMNTRSISKSGGISTFRSSVVVEKSAKQAKSAVSCQSLMLDSESRSDTIPAMDIRTRDAAIGHEAKIGSISNDAVFYLMSRGMSEEDARALIVAKFFIPIFLEKKIFTMPQFLEERFDRRVKTVMAFFWLAVFIFINLTSILYLGALTIENVMGVPMLAGIIGLAAFAGIYSIYGGLKAVALTDVIQVVFLIGGGIQSVHSRLRRARQSQALQGYYGWQ